MRPLWDFWNMLKTVFQSNLSPTIPFNRINAIVGDKVADKVGDKSLNTTRQRIIKEMRNNPNITHPQLMRIIGIEKLRFKTIYNTCVKMVS